MSRNIPAKPSVTLVESERGLWDTEEGKLIFTEYRGQQCALLLKGGRVLAVSFFSDNAVSAIGAIYVGRVKNIAKNIEACFVETGKGAICFLPMKKAVSPFLTNRVYDGRLQEGDEILVQVEREAQKTKQASATAQISLSDDYFVITLGSGRLGFSAKLSREKREEIAGFFSAQGIVMDGNMYLVPEKLPEDSAVKAEMEKLLQGMPGGRAASLPAIGVIARTKVGELTGAKEILDHFYQLLERFYRLLSTAVTRSCFSCLLEAPPPWEAVLHNLAEPDEYREIVTDDAGLYQTLSVYCEEYFPGKEVRLYQDGVLSLSSLYALGSKLEPALKPKVWLKSGGYLVIEPTEALTVIDVNSGKNEAGRSAEALRRINYEAAEEIALQLRLRNLSGIILVDFINMEDRESGKELLEHLRILVRDHRVKTTVVDITPLGLVEITRKKQSRPLWEQIYQ